MTTKNRNLLVVIVATLMSGAICLFDFWTVFTGEDVFFHWDLIRFEFAIREYFLRLLRVGDFTALYPLSGLGLSLFANPHYKIFYPTNLFVMLFSDIRLGLHFDHLLHYFILASGWSMAILAAGLKRPAAFFVPIAICSSGIIWSSHYRVELASMAWTGWLIWSLCSLRSSLDMTRPPGALRRARLRAASLAGLFAGWIFLGGNPELLVPTLIATSALLLFQDQNPTDAKTKFVAANLKCLPASLLVSLLVFALVFAIVIAPVVWTAIDVVPFTVRAYGFNLRSIFQMPQSPASLFELITSLPRSIFENQALRLTDGHEIDRIWYLDSRIGWIPLLSACWGIYIQRRRFSWIQALMIILFLVLALGPYIPQIQGLWIHVPGMRSFRYTGKFFRFAYLVLIPFMAIGFSALINDIKSKHRMIIVVGGAILVTIIQLHVTRPIDDLASTATVFSPGSFTGLVDSSRNNPSNPPRVLICPIDEDTAPGIVTPWLDLKHRGVPMAKSMDAAEMPMIRALDCRWVKHYPILAAFGISHLIVPTPLGVRTLVTLTGTNPAMGNIIDRAKIESFPLIREVGPFEDYKLPWGQHLDSIKWGTVFVDSSQILAENGRPSTINVDHIEKLVGSAQCKTQVQTQDQTQDCHANFQPVALTLNPTNDRIHAEVSAARGSIMIVPWTALAGWHATIDGHPIEILRINASVMGIPLPSGFHHIELRFMPHGLVPLLWISIVIQITIVLYVVTNLAMLLQGTVSRAFDSASRRR